MPEIPECLQQRYKKFDELITDMDAMPGGSQSENTHPGVKLLCNFWNILKDDPNCNLSAASFDSKCQFKLKELLAAEKYLKAQIARLEEKEKKGVKLMKEADEMWVEMENSYKEKIAQSHERQQNLIIQLQDIEESAAKWRKNKRDLESQLGSLNKCQCEMTDKINQKVNDLKAIDNEIAAYKKRIENTKKEAANLKTMMTHKMKNSNDRLENIKKVITDLQYKVKEETKRKNEITEKGKKSITEAREDLQKICKTLMQRRLEAEDLRAENKALMEEIDALKDTCDHCKEKCSNKQKGIADEIKKTDLEIANFVLKCKKCSQCVDSRDFRTLCVNCPRCQEYRVCKVGDAECKSDPAEECVCSKVKRMFLDNVFENMSTVLEKSVNTKAGRALGGEILKCLKNSLNAKLNDHTRKMLQNYVLQSVKQNLTLTIVGGAVKTRCELDADTYKQLLLCLKGVKPTPPPKADKGTNAKKEPCKRWGGHTECHCPKGPENCICTRKAPPSVKDPKTCPPEPSKDPAEKVVCPHHDGKPCGPDCGAHNTFDLDRVGADVAKFRPDACSPDVCTFGKNMRAAQCVLGPESLKSPPKSKLSIRIPHVFSMEDETNCTCNGQPVKPCSCERGAKQLMSGKLKCSDLENIDFKSKPIKYKINRVHPRDQSRKTSDKEDVSCPDREICPMYKSRNPFFIVKDSENENIADTNFIKSEIKGSHTTSKQLEKDSIVDTHSIKSEVKASGIPSQSLKNDDKKDVACLDGKICPMYKPLNPFLIVKDSEKDSITDTYVTDTYSIKSEVKTSGLSSNQLESVRESDAANVVDNCTNPFVSYRNQTPLLLVKDSSDHIIHTKSEEIVTPIYPNVNTTIKDSQKSLDEYRKELQLFYENEQYLLNIELIAENGVSTNADTFIKKTSSGNVALDISVIDNIGVMLETETERPVHLSKSQSGNYRAFLGYQSDEDNKAPNAVLRRTPSNSLLVVVTEPIMIFLANDLTPNERNNEYYKVKLKGVSLGEKIPPAILRSSPSNNYLIVIDKEFEKKCTDFINSTLDDHKECFVELQKCDSNIVINLNENSKKNAVLVKTPSDSIKILVNGPLFDHLSDNDQATKKNTYFCQIEDIMYKLPSDGKTHLPIISKAKSSSYSNLCRKSVQENHFLSRVSTKFQRTESGQYAAILDKESRNSLINNLRTQLTQSFTNRLPIKISDSGHITIILNNDENEQSYFGTFKITPSGKVFIVVDKNVLKDIEKKEKKYLSKFGSEHIIRKVKHPENKSTITSCSSRIEDSGSDRLKNNLRDSSEISVDEFGNPSCGYDTIPHAKRVCKNNFHPESCTAECCTAHANEYPNFCPGNNFDTLYFSESLNRYENKCFRNSSETSKDDSGNLLCGYEIRPPAKRVCEKSCHPESCTAECSTAHANKYPIFGPGNNLEILYLNRYTNKCFRNSSEISVDKSGNLLCGFEIRTPAKRVCKKSCHPELYTAKCCTAHADKYPNYYLGNNLDSFNFSESVYSYDDECLSKDISYLNDLCKRLINDV